MASYETPGLLASAGAGGTMALLLGLVLLTLGIVVAVRRGTHGQAFALVVAALLPFLLGSIGTAMGTLAAQDSIIKLGPAVTPKDLAAGRRQELAAKLLGTGGTILALCGATAALARSKTA